MHLMFDDRYMCRKTFTNRKLRSKVIREWQIEVWLNA